MENEEMLTVDTEEQDLPTADEEAIEPVSEVEVLRARVAELEATLSKREQLAERMTCECEEFEAYFPEVSLRSLPESVWTQVHAGVPLAAAYALYERGVQNQKKKTEEQAARAATCMVGLPGAADEHYFSPAQVRAMSRREVRENYDRIFESMRHWQ